MSKLLDWIKENAKEGANIAEAEELVNTGTFDGIKTKEQAIDFMGKNEVFKSANDSLISTAVSNHDERFMSEKFPGLIKAEKEKFRKELNPDLTPEQKRIAELEERDRLRDEKDQLRDAQDAKKDLEKTLRQKAVDLKYDPLKAEKYSIYGEKAVEMLESEAKDFNAAIEAAEKGFVKSSLSGPAPKSGDPVDTGKRAELITKYNEAEKNGDGNTMFALKEQIRKIPKQE